MVSTESSGGPSLEPGNESAARDARVDRAATDREQALSDRDQTASDQDQSASDDDQTGSEKRLGSIGARPALVRSGSGGR